MIDFKTYNNIKINHLQGMYLRAVEQAMEEVLKDITLLEQALAKDSAQTPQATEITGLVIETLTLELRELSLLLRDNNLRAKKLAKKLTVQLSASTDTIHWNQLLDALAELDFEKAQDQLQTVAADLKITLR